MAEGTSMIDLGEISKPATVLVEKIADAVGGMFRPYQIKRIARAEAEADIIRAQGQIEGTDLQRRAMRRFVAEEAKKQENMESITSKALPQLEDRSRPADVNDDWITNFFDKCRIVSDEEMQQIWAKVLAGEANSPGTYSKRTVNFLSSLDKSDAVLFTKLCGFGWQIGDVATLIYDEKDPIYSAAGITFSVLSHLDDIGLISFQHLTGFRRMGFPKHITVFYYGQPVNIEFQQETGNDLQTGKVLLTQIGEQMAPICGSRRSQASWIMLRANGMKKDCSFLHLIPVLRHKFSEFATTPCRGLSFPR